MRFVSFIALGLCLSPAAMADEPQQAPSETVVEVAAAEPAPAPAAPAAETLVADAADEKICKVRNKTGSRVRTVKTCMTRAEWQELRQHNSRMVLEDAGYTRQPEQ